MAIEYCIADGRTDKNLVEEVNRLISEGWVPLGGVAVDSVSIQGWYVQAMYREIRK